MKRLGLALPVTQHRGGGKANQSFCQGFDIGHGTDFDTMLAGIPPNHRYPFIFKVLTC